MHQQQQKLELERSILISFCVDGFFPTLNSGGVGRQQEAGWRRRGFVC